MLSFFLSNWDYHNLLILKKIYIFCECISPSLSCLVAPYKRIIPPLVPPATMYTQHCTTLHRTTLHCTALYFTALYFTALNCTALYCTVLHTAIHQTALHYTAPYCIVLHLAALPCTQYKNDCIISLHCQYILCSSTLSLPLPLWEPIDLVSRSQFFHTINVIYVYKVSSHLSYVTCHVSHAEAICWRVCSTRPTPSSFSDICLPHKGH